MLRTYSKKDGLFCHLRLQHNIPKLPATDLVLYQSEDNIDIIAEIQAIAFRREHIQRGIAVSLSVDMDQMMTTMSQAMADGVEKGVIAAVKSTQLVQANPFCAQPKGKCFENAEFMF